MSRRRAFTLIELLVVVAIIALLIAILLPQLGKAKENARKVVCGTNLKAQGTSFAIYANQNNDYLPYLYPTTPTTFSHWWHDQPKELVDALVLANTPTGTGTLNNISANDGAKRRFFCPSMNVTSSGIDKAWDHADGSNNPNYRALGYTYLNDRTANSGPTTDPMQIGYYQKDGVTGCTVSPRPGGIAAQGGGLPILCFHTKYSAEKDPSVSELCFDEMVTQSVNAQASFTDIIQASTGYPGETTSHVRGRLASGQNLLHFDNHVDWRTYGGSAQTATSLVLGASQQSPAVYWLQNP